MIITVSDIEKDGHHFSFKIFIKYGTTDKKYNPIIETDIEDFTGDDCIGFHDCVEEPDSAGVRWVKNTLYIMEYNNFGYANRRRALKTKLTKEFMKESQKEKFFHQWLRSYKHQLYKKYKNIELSGYSIWPQETTIPGA